MKIKQLKIFVILLAILLTVRLSEGDDKDKAFIKKVKGVGYVMDAIQTTDGNYISVSRPKGRATNIVMKVTPLGQRIWERSFSVGVANGAYMSLTSIAQTNEGYVLVGEFSESPGELLSTAIVVALRSDGTVNWTKRFGDPTIGVSRGFTTVTSAPDGGFIARGWSFPQSIAVKFASNGDIQWQKAFVYLDSLFSQSTSDNGLILAAPLLNGADIIKLDYSGDILWKRSLTIENFDLAAIGYDPDRGVVIAGRSINPSMLLLIGLDSNGKIVWRANFSMEDPFSISRIVPTADGGYAMTGATKKKSGSYAGFLLKIDAQKHLVFQRFGVRSPESIFATNEGGFILFGGTGYNLFFSRLNSDGIVPDCPYFHNLSSKRVPKSAVNVGPSNFSLQSLSFPAPTVFDLISKRSRHSMSTICQ